MRCCTQMAHLKHVARSQLTEDCKDLLDRILTIDEKKRISIADIKEHAWFNRPLSPKFKAAEEELYARQQRLDSRLESRILDEVGCVFGQGKGGQGN